MTDTSPGNQFDALQKAAIARGIALHRAEILEEAEHTYRHILPAVASSTIH